MKSEVNVVGVTQPTKYTGCKTANELIAWAARVSNPANQSNTMTAIGLVRYLIKHEHWSPFEMVHVAIEIKTTRDIARQMLRHRSFSFQEYSQRYADPTADLDFVVRETRFQDQKNRQNSIEIGEITDTMTAGIISEEWRVRQQVCINSAQETHRWATTNGIAKEQARAVLPEGNTESVLIMSGTLRSWIHYCKLRMKPDTQKEHRIVAEQCWNALKEEFNDIVEAVQQIEMAEALKTQLWNTLQKAIKNQESPEDTANHLKALVSQYY